MTEPTSPTPSSPTGDARPDEARPERTTTAPTQADPTIGALVHDLTTQLPELVRAEIRLAQAEIAEKGKRAGIGIGLFGAAGLLAFFGAATLVTTVVLALALLVPAWLAALLVTIVLLAAAGVLALRGRSKVQEASPPVPERAVAGVKEDIATVKGQRP